MDVEEAPTCKDRRTNSLAFARSDCHTCASTGEKCDRRRPRCSTCLNHGRKCGGFAIPLSWDPRRMWSDNPSAVNDDHPGLPEGGQLMMTGTPRVDLTASHRPAPRRYRFIEGASKPRKQRKAYIRGNNTARSRSVVPESESGGSKAMPRLVGENFQLDMAIYNQNENDLGIQDTHGADPLDDLGFFDSLVPSLFEFGQDSFTTEMPTLMSLARTPPLSERAIDFMAENLQPDPLANTFDPLLPGTTPKEVGSNSFDHNTTQVSTLAVSPPQTDTSFGLSPRDHDWLLEMYDYEFCVLPLTSDISINPFRCQRQTSQGSRLLFHSILALCCQHLRRLTGSWDTEAGEHHRKALQLLDDALKQKQTISQLNLLEPILILFTFDCTLSAAGKWTTHLNRAHSILQMCGGATSLNTPRVRSQVGMLLWWDATLALISRHGPIMDKSYLKFLVEWEKQDKWSFFDLTGCPGDLIVHLFHLAELAQQSEIARSMEWLSFNISPVIAIEKKLGEWINDLSPEENDLDLPNAEAEDRLHEQQDRYYCAEAWRFTLLLYIESVFKSDRQKRPFAVNKLVRKTIDSIRCCRRTSQTQKQLLLPVFLAGSETSNEDMRNFVKDYCSYWGDKSRYGMFNSTPILLDEIWTTGRWWGEVIDSKAGPSGHGQAQTQLLFG
ncbi:unnamed protein product [Penicillium salamii]|uniref:Zn(2)-C6 fungal-type domain-containing protein n=1 Tax=Penicillium salamii TaxID=1612424 RepID=A0A9W4JXS4_9EURO|nr:unnamed protein product [Penicillium salamii]